MTESDRKLIEMLRLEPDFFCNSAVIRLEELASENTKLRTVLSFYANEDIYLAYDNHGHGDISVATDDAGKRAQWALETKG